MMDLSGTWALRDAEGEYAVDMTLPGDGISALLDAGKIADPYWGRNEYDTRWVAEREWTATREVTLEDTAQVLVIDGLDCVAEVFVNGSSVLQADNAFRLYRVDLSEVARKGKNRIEILFRSTPAEARARQARQPMYIPYSKNCPIPDGNLVRKPHCDFGWDWNIALAPFGVWNAIRLEPKTRYRISAVAVTQTHSKGKAVVEVDVEVEAERPMPFDWEIRLCGQTVAGHSVFADRKDSFTAKLTIRDPDLWWPNGQGDQVLHDLTVKVGDQVATRRIGLRDLKLVVQKDKAGTAFKFKVNGRDVFMKGANWIPADALPQRIRPEGVKDLLQSAVDVHMNMIRVWGGGRYEPDWFYDLCDEMGLLVWQDFMFACSLYPSDEDFLDEVADEVRENALRLNHHPSIAVWCGDNELLGALNWYPESKDNRDTYLVAYDRLNRVIERALKAALPQAIWWPSSPSPGYMNFGDAWHDDRSGDMHFWSVWHEGRDFDHYRDVSPRFCSEFGFQSYPSMEVIRTFAGPEDWNIAAPVFESHQKNDGGNARIAETMFRYFRFPVDFPNFVYVSQVQQALAIKTAVTHWRSLRPHCMGTLYWQLNDTWPVCSWASLDYGGGWKILHHLARDFYAPVLVTAVPKDGAIRLVAVNDRAEPVEVSVTAYATKMDGTAREIGKGSASVGGSAATLATLPEGTLAADEVLTFGWDGSDGTHAGDVFAPRPWKAYDLLDPGLEYEVAEEDGAFVLTITAKAMAFFLTAEASVPGRWDRNAVHLGPGAVTKLKFTPQASGEAPEFLLRDLHSATYGRPQ